MKRLTEKYLTVKCFIGLSEEITAILSLFSSLSSSIVQSFTLKSWHMYLSAVVGIFSGVASPMIRAILSKSVPPEDNGINYSKQ